jgi:polar amino acid transport system substrate-binding protein
MRILSFIFAFSLCMSSWSEGVAAETKEVTFAFADVESFPYQMGEGSTVIADMPGLAVDIIKKAGEEIGLKINFKRFPNNRVLHTLEKNEVDGAFIFSFKDDRKKSGAFPMKGETVDKARHVAILSYYFYQKADGKLEWDGKTLKNADKPIGANLGYSIAKDLKDMNIKVEEAKSMEQNFSKLEKNRLSGYAQQELLADSYLKEIGSAAFKKLEKPISTKEYYLMLSHKFVKENKDLAEKLWNKIAEIRNDIVAKNLDKYLRKG